MEENKEVARRWECGVCGSLFFHKELTEPKYPCSCGAFQYRLLSERVFTQEEIDKANIKLGESYEDLIKVWKYYLDFPEEYYKFFAIWEIATYFFDEFDTFPIIYLNAIKGSAKTRTSKLNNFLACKGNGMITNSLTEATFFRHPSKIPMAIDECERIGTKDFQSLREIINSVYKKGAIIPRMKKVKTKEGEQFIAESFSPRFPLTLANISGFEEVLEDRGFTLTLEKSNDPSFVNLMEDWDRKTSIINIKRTLEQNSVVSVVKLRKKMYVNLWNSYIKEDNYTNYITTLTTLNYTNYTKTTLEDIEKAEREEFFCKLLNSGITGRNLEISFPLLITAKLISDEVFEDILKIIKELIKSKRENEYADNKDVMIYDFVANYPNTLEFVPVKSLVEKFRLFSGEHDEWLNEKWIGKALKRSNLILDKKRMNSGIFIILNVAKAKNKIKMFKTEEENAPS